MIKINVDLGYLAVAQEQERKIEQSRRLHDVLVQCEVDLKELDENPFRYSVAEVNLRRNAIIQLRQQARDEIEKSTQ